MSEALDRLRTLAKDMDRLEIPYEEWEVLLREKLILERALLRVAVGLAEKPEDATRPREGAAALDGTGHDAGATRRSHRSSRTAAADTATLRSLVASAVLAGSPINRLPASNMLSRLSGPSAVTVSRRGLSARMILRLVGWQ